MTQQTVTQEPITHCIVCNNAALEEVLDLPAFPLTGIYVDAPSPEKYPNVDQGLNVCPACGHAQLRNTIDPAYLYGYEYSHRSSTSPIASQGNDFFLGFLNRITQGARFQRVLEVGCNDLYLLRKLASRAEFLLGIDPVWAGEDQVLDNKIKVVGKFVEQVDFRSEMGGAPDLIVSVHTMEHIRYPMDVIRRLIDAAAPGALIMIEVPGFDSQLNTCRFDQVFHQHIQYFSVASFRRLIEAVGGRYIAHTFNYDYWGGTLLIAMQKGGNLPVLAQSDSPKPTAEVIAQRLGLFRRQLDVLGEVLASQRNPVYGFGAAQMLPTLAYHMKSDLSFLRCIWDDNPSRNQKTYPHLPVRIRRPDPETTLEDGTVLITALDSTRPILKRLLDLKPRYIIRPLAMM